MPDAAPRRPMPTRWILDTAALLNGAWDRAAEACLVPPAVAAELTPGGRDHARFAALSAAGLQIVPPDATAVQTARDAARQLGESRLSAADLEVAALTLERKGAGEAVRAVTDDYALQNLLTHLGLPYQGARMEGIRETRRYALRCSGCGRWWPPDGAVKEGTECPVCGAEIRRKRSRADGAQGSR